MCRAWPMNAMEQSHTINITILCIFCLLVRKIVRIYFGLKFTSIRWHWSRNAHCTLFSGLRKLSEFFGQIEYSVSESNSQVIDGTGQEMSIAPCFCVSESCPNNFRNNWIFQFFACILFQVLFKNYPPRTTPHTIACCFQLLCHKMQLITNIIRSNSMWQLWSSLSHTNTNRFLPNMSNRIVEQTRLLAIIAPAAVLTRITASDIVRSCAGGVVCAARLDKQTWKQQQQQKKTAHTHDHHHQPTKAIESTIDERSKCRNRRNDFEFTQSTYIIDRFCHWEREREGERLESKYQSLFGMQYMLHLRVCVCSVCTAKVILSTGEQCNCISASISIVVWIGRMHAAQK